MSNECSVRTVLIVDNDTALLHSMVEGLKEYAHYFRIERTEDAAKAMACLETLAVDLVMVGIAMPVAEEHAFLSSLKKQQVRTPLIVMTSGEPDHRSRELLRQFGASHIVRKPFDLKDVTPLIFNELQSGASSCRFGFGLPAFLQMIETEQRTCSLTLTSGDESGCLYFKKGRLTGAETGQLKGIDAANRMLEWGHSDIALSARCHQGRKTAEKSSGLEHPAEEEPMPARSGHGRLCM